MKQADITPGTVVWSVGRRRMGNTTMTTIYTTKYVILAVGGGYVTLRGHYGNTTIPMAKVRRFFTEQPVLVRQGFRYRLETPEEKKTRLRLNSDDTATKETP